MLLTRSHTNITDLENINNTGNNNDLNLSRKTYEILCIKNPQRNMNFDTIESKTTNSANNKLTWTYMFGL